MSLPADATGLRTLDDLGDVAGRRVLVRVDFNVPFAADGAISDDTRIRLALPTLETLRDRRADLLLVAHLGRPKNREPSLSLRPIAAHLATLLDEPVAFAPHLDEIPRRPLVMLENIRFEAGETANDPALAQRLAALADAYVNDAFGAAHRAHASTEGIVHHLDRCAAGLLFEREVSVLGTILRDPNRPLVAVLGGSKATDKIGVIHRFLEIADAVLLGGAMSYPFRVAQGRDVGRSLCEPAGVEAAQRVLEHPAAAEKLHLPRDLMVADSFGAEANLRVVDIEHEDIDDPWEAIDIGPRTRELYTGRIAGAGTVFWNGPVGAFEVEPFAAGTHVIAKAVAATSATTVVGGGDSLAALAAFGLEDSVSHLSTGGGATLEFIEGRDLPGLAALAKER